jgi:RES domain-containing protein
MRGWRVSNFADLSGTGGRMVAGRWHERGRPVVYLAEHPALALLETIVHLEVDPRDLPKGYRLLSIDVADDLAIREFRETELDQRAPGWRRDHAVTRDLARPWFEEGATALLRVPSVLVPHATNFVLNPLHEDAAKMTIISDEMVEFDERLLLSRRSS